MYTHTNPTCRFFFFTSIFGTPSSPSRRRAMGEVVPERSGRNGSDGSEASEAVGTHFAHPSIETLIHKYDGILLDQWGVIHDGEKAFNGAPAALRQLGSKGVKVVVVSNSTKRATSTMSRLAQMGFDTECVR